MTTSTNYEYEVTIVTVIAERFGSRVEVYDEPSTPDYTEFYKGEEDAKADYDEIDNETLGVDNYGRSITWKEARIVCWAIDGDNSSSDCEILDSKHAASVDGYLRDMGL